MRFLTGKGSNRELDRTDFRTAFMHNQHSYSIMINVIPSKDGVPAKITCQCPYCGMNTTVTTICWTLDKWICQCDNSKCNKTFFADVEYQKTVVNPGEPPVIVYDIIETYPKFVPERHESIPENVWSDYLEASNCFNAKSYKGTVAMCRRVLQNVCFSRGATNKDAQGNWIKLRDQIKTAFPQQDYSLLHQLSDAIKYLGDYDAHPQDDGIDKVTCEDAKTILDFTLEILKIAYVQQWNIKKLLQSNSAKT
jgi:hypothetical protein